MIHLTSVTPDQITGKHDLCEQCARKFGSEYGIDESPFLSELVSEHPRYRPEAYMLVQEAWLRVSTEIFGDLSQFFDHSKDPKMVADEVGTYLEKHKPQMPEPEESARLILEELRKLALRRFGKKAKSRLAEYGVRSCRDFGEIAALFNPQFGNSPEERVRWFDGGYDFNETFPES